MLEPETQASVGVRLESSRLWTGNRGGSLPLGPKSGPERTWGAQSRARQRHQEGSFSRQNQGCQAMLRGGMGERQAAELWLSRESGQ